MTKLNFTKKSGYKIIKPTERERERERLKVAIQDQL